MSRGYGKCQQAILTKSQGCSTFYLAELLPRGYALKDYQALHRAACTLFKEGKIGMVRYMCGGRKVLITWPGLPRPAARPMSMYKGSPDVTTYTHNLRRDGDRP